MRFKPITTYIDQLVYLQSLQSDVTRGLIVKYELEFHFY